MQVKIKCPLEYNGKPVQAIEGFSIGPDGIERDKLMAKLFDEDDRLRQLYEHEDQAFKDQARAQIREKLDTLYTIQPGETISLPEDHAEILLQTFGFLERGAEEPAAIVPGGEDELTQANTEETK